MRLIDYDDLEYICGDEIYDMTVDGDVVQEGPFLFAVNNLGAWMGTYNERAQMLLEIQIHHETVLLSTNPHWQRAVEVWLRDEDITRPQMLRKYSEIENRLKGVEKSWTSWEDLNYGNLPEVSELLWDGLWIHRRIRIETINGERYAIWKESSVNTAWLRHWEREQRTAS